MLPPAALRRSARHRAPALLVATLAVGGAGCERVRAAVGAAPALHGAAYTTPEPAPPLRLPWAGRLRSAAADTFDLARDGAGRAALVFFGYTHCPDVCPTTLADWTRVRRALAAGDAADTARVRFVFVTVDPERDSAAVVARYVAQFDSTFVGLTGTRAAVDAAQTAWHVSSFRDAQSGGAPTGGAPTEGAPTAHAPAAGYTVSHPAQVFLVGPDGHLRTIYPLGVPVADVAADVHVVLHGG